MAMVPGRGSLDTSLGRDRPQLSPTEVHSKVPPATIRDLHNDPIVADSFTNQQSLNQDAYRDRVDHIAAYPEGIPVVVSFFSKNQPIIDSRTFDSTFSRETQSNNHMGYTLIHNFEIRFVESMQFEYNKEDNRTSVHGEGYVYPGFTPNIGDFFYYPVADGNHAIMNVNDVERMAIGQGTFHKISFGSIDWLTDQLKDKYLSQVTSEMYFDKVKFVAGDMSLLTSEEYVVLNELKRLRKNLIDDYMLAYYDSSMGSFMRPDKIYDPYAVNFWNQKVSVTEHHIRPTQLLPQVRNYERTLLGVLSTNEQTTNFKRMLPMFHICHYGNNFWSTGITSLINCPYLAIGERNNKHHPRPINTSAPRAVNFDAHDMDNLEEDFLRRRIEFYGSWPIYVGDPNHHHDHPGEEPDDGSHTKPPRSEDITYGLPKEFYVGSAMMDTLSKMVYDCLVKNEIHPSKVYRELAQYTEWCTKSAYYHVLIGLYLVDKAIWKLTH